MALLTLLALIAVSRSLLAQRADDCASYAATLRGGALTQTDSQSRAYAGIQRCAAATRATGISAALERRRTLGRLDDLQTEAFAFATRDPRVFDQLILMAGDPAVSPTSRVLAIATLLAMVDTHTGMPLEYFVRHREGDFCVAGGSPVAHPAFGGPLPADSTPRVIATLAPLERSRSTEPSVRSAAHCAMNVLRLASLGQTAPLAPFTSTDLTVSYVCGSRFRVINRSAFTVLAAVYTSRAAPPVALRIAGARGGAGHETLFNGGPDGPVRLVVDDVAYTAANAHQPCGHR
jgi:hypothetical protein